MRYTLHRRCVVSNRVTRVDRWYNARQPDQGMQPDLQKSFGSWRQALHSSVHHYPRRVR